VEIGLPDELTTIDRLLRLPPLPEIPEPVRGKSFVIVEAIHPEAGAAVGGYVEAVKKAVEPWTARHAYLNFADTERDPGTPWTEQAHRRLRRIKQAVDPGNLIRSNHPVR
jgi:hypothetical protein